MNIAIIFLLPFFIDPRWTVRLGPRALSTGVVVSVGEGFVWINPLDIILKTKTLHNLDLLLTLPEAKEYN